MQDREEKVVKVCTSAHSMNYDRDSFEVILRSSAELIEAISTHSTNYDWDSFIVGLQSSSELIGVPMANQDDK